MNFLEPQIDLMTMPASHFRWGRIIGRANLGEFMFELREMGITIRLVSDNTGIPVDFSWNGVIQRRNRTIGGQQPPPYGEWLSMSKDPKLSKLKIHIVGLDFKR